MAKRAKKWILPKALVKRFRVTQTLIPEISTPVVELENVSKSFGGIAALDGVSLAIPAGQAIAFLGPNGAGKSTTISLMLGLLRPSGGRVSLFGKTPWDPASRRMIGATPQDTDFPPNLTVSELLRLVASHFPHPAGIAELLSNFGLTDLANRAASKLSGGERRKLALAMAFTGNPKAVFLDEPTAGLDVEARRLFWDAVDRFHSHSGTVFLTTHHMEEAEALARRVVLINRGRVVQQGSVADIKARVGYRRLRFQAGEAPTLSLLAGCDFSEGWVTVSTTDADGLVRAMVEAGVEFSNLEIEAVSLEEAVVSAFHEDAPESRE
jgi:ABC-2 type transport system ATP-binding protein